MHTPRRMSPRLVLNALAASADDYFTAVLYDPLIAGGRICLTGTKPSVVRCVRPCNSTPTSADKAYKYCCPANLVHVHTSRPVSIKVSIVRARTLLKEV